ncbi:hypothetical protein C8J56DRAFT_161319 [Mycena floridula]|nr:hypothetical protein C8J56DRAFT_161319 [Mycena floridula]
MGAGPNEALLMDSCYGRHSNSGSHSCVHRHRGRRSVDIGTQQGSTNGLLPFAPLRPSIIPSSSIILPLCIAIILDIPYRSFPVMQIPSFFRFLVHPSFLHDNPFRQSFINPLIIIFRALGSSTPKRSLTPTPSISSSSKCSHIQTFRMWNHAYRAIFLQYGSRAMSGICGWFCGGERIKGYAGLQRSNVILFANKHRRSWTRSTL